MRMLAESDPAFYCGASCAAAAAEDRRARRRESRGLQDWRDPGDSAAHWRVAVGDRHLAGSRLDSRARCIVHAKVRYESLAEAWVAAFVDFPRAPGLGAYPCEDCSGFHLGRSRYGDAKKARRIARARFLHATRQMLPTTGGFRK